MSHEALAEDLATSDHATRWLEDDDTGPLFTVMRTAAGDPLVGVCDPAHVVRGSVRQEYHSFGTSDSWPLYVLDAGHRTGRDPARGEWRPSGDQARRALDGLMAVITARSEPPCHRLGQAFRAHVADISQVRAVVVTAFGRAFHITTVIDAYDPDVCQQVYERERRLYQSHPSLEAEFRVLTQRHADQLRALRTVERDFCWVRG